MITLPWLSAELATLRAAHSAGRLAHALLIHEAPGAGGDWLARWVTQLVLCERGESAPCGLCPACSRVSAGRHPDVIRVGFVEESRQLRIEQVRQLSEELALTSHQGGFKVGVLSPADALNRFAANALLKTLEEPPPRTLLLLVVTQPSRLPPTILSRCQRIRVRAPQRAQAIAWLTATAGKADWGGVLEVIGNAPLLAAAADPALVVQVNTETRQALEEALAGRLDPTATAERWARAEPALHLRCFENWLTECIAQKSGAAAFLTELRAVPYLPQAQNVLNIRRLFELLDAVRELKSELDMPINRGLALEALLRSLQSSDAQGWRNAG